MNNEFIETRKLFQTVFQYDRTKPLSFDQWLKIPDDQKSAVLYLQFYDQITLAWDKTKSFYTLTADGVSTVLQYLEKNVPIIKANPKKFNERYIYRVAYNCLSCICHDLIYPRLAYEHEVPEEISGHSDDGSRFSYYDLISDRNDDIEKQIADIEADRQLQIFWDAVEKDEDTTMVIEKFLDIPNDQIIKHLKVKFGTKKKRIPTSINKKLNDVPKMISSVILDLCDPDSDIFNPEFNLSEFKIALSY